MRAGTASSTSLDDGEKSGAWQRRKEQREPEILAAARRLFESRGVDDTSVAAIAAEAGVSEATVFKYFANKQELIERVVHAWIEPYAEQLEKDVRTLSGARARLEHIASRHLADMVRSPQLHIITYRNLRWDHYQESELRRLVQRWTRIGVWTIEQGVAEGEIRSDVDVTTVRDLFYGGLEQAGLRTALSGRFLDVDAQAKAIVNIVLSGIVAVTSARPTVPAERIEVAIAALERIEAALGVGDPAKGGIK